jgi:hypothetical protein
MISCSRSDIMMIGHHRYAAQAHAEPRDTPIIPSWQFFGPGQDRGGCIFSIDFQSHPKEENINLSNPALMYLLFEAILEETKPISKYCCDDPDE